MIIKIHSKDLWVRLPRAHNPDKDFEDWIKQRGDFSLYKSIAFDKHLNKLNYWTTKFNSFNGQRIKLIKEQEPLWY